MKLANPSAKNPAPRRRVPLLRLNPQHTPLQAGRRVYLVLSFKQPAGARGHKPARRPAETDGGRGRQRLSDADLAGYQDHPRLENRLRAGENRRDRRRPGGPVSVQISHRIYVPKELPLRSTLFDYFDLWNWDGTLARIHHALYVQCHEAMGREASPTACVIDSQSVKSAGTGGVGSILMATTREKRSRASSAISSSTR
ncbi:hypothetical protein M2322_004858 [Rhodoblastus acidophilus]|nr:hypothetical protein [Rhodoblastus acidophilus]